MAGLMRASEFIQLVIHSPDLLLKIFEDGFKWVDIYRTAGRIPGSRGLVSFGVCDRLDTVALSLAVAIVA